MSTYLVTGANGFVGAALSARLLQEGHSVRMVVRRALSAPREHGNGHAERASTHVVSLGDPNALAELAQGVDVLYHCAAENSLRAHPAAFGWINVAATENVVNAARHAGVKRLVHLSCTDATLVNRDRLNWREAHPIGDEPLDALCKSRLLGEELAVHSSGRRLQVCALRPAWVWGPGDRALLPALCREAQRGRVSLCGNGENLVATVYIDNLIHALRLAESAVEAPGKVFHILDAEAQTAREFIGALCQSLGVRAPTRGSFALSYAAAQLAEWLGLGGRTRSDVIRRGRGSLFDGMAAANDLGYRAVVSLSEGMQALASWAAAVGGHAAIAQLTRPATSQADIEALIALADAT